MDNKSNSVVEEIQRRYPNLSKRQAELLVIEILNQVAKNIIDGKNLAFIKEEEDTGKKLITTISFHVNEQIPKVLKLNEEGILKISASRVSTVNETAEFLKDLSNAYKGAFMLELYESGDTIFYDEFPKNYELQISKVNFNSPGFWEFLGSLNPLQQIREYLKDRHERKKDNNYKNELDKKKLALENDKLKNELDLQEIEKDKKLLENMAIQNSIIKERLEMIKSLGLPQEKITVMIERQFVEPMLRLNKYQDNGLIGEIEVSKSNTNLLK